MGWIKDTFFGGAAKDAAAAQVDSFEKAMELQRQYSEQARQDAMNLFGPGYADMMAGYQAAQDQIAQGRTSTADIYTQATQNANRALQQGAQGSISAILGRPQQIAPLQQVPGGTVTPTPSPGDVVRPPADIQNPVTDGGGQQPAQPQPQPPSQPPISRPPSKSPGQWQPLGQQGGSATTALAPQGLRKNVQSLDFQRPQPSSIGSMITDFTGRAMTGMREQDGELQPMSAVDVPPEQNIAAQNLPAVSMPNMNTAMIMPDVSGIGLSGAEQAITGGAQGAENALTGGLAGATGTYRDALGQQMSILGGAQAQGRQDIQQGLRSQLGALGAGFGGAESVMNQGFDQGRQDLLGTMSGVGNIFGQAIGNVGSAGSGAVGSIRQGVNTATGRLDPYAQAGQGALDVEAAMAGALGPEAQAQAYANFSESPAQKFNRERQEQALLRNASAIGGLRGGSTLTALQEQASGIAAQQEQRYLDNLRSLAGRGQQAAGQQAGFNMQGGQAAANAMQNTASTQAGLYGQQAGLQGQLGQSLANMASQQGQAVGGLRSQLGQLQSGAIGQGAQTLAGMGQNFANMGLGAIGSMAGNLGQAQLGTGQQIAGLRQGTGQQLGGLRMQAGQQVAGQLGGLGQGIAQNQLNLGQQLGGLDQNSIANIANLLQSQGESGYNSRMQLAQILANLASGQGTNLSNLQSQIGAAQAGGITGSAQGAQSGIGTVAGLIAAFSDIRLKDNVQKVADVDGIGLYSWTWKDKAPVANIAGEKSFGVIAQEIEKTHPQYIGERDGYMTVDYAGLAQELAK